MFSFLNKAAETVRAHTTEFVEEFVKETLEIKQELTWGPANDGEETSSGSTDHRARKKQSVTSTGHLPEQFQAKLDALKRKEETFTVELSQEGLLAFPFTDDEVTEWEVDEVIGAAYQRLVPSQVERDVFWRRFLARLHLLKKEEANLTQIMSKHAAEDDEDVAWGSDDEEQVLFDADEGDAAPSPGTPLSASAEEAPAAGASVSAPAGASGEAAEEEVPLAVSAIKAPAAASALSPAEAEVSTAAVPPVSSVAETAPVPALTPLSSPAPPSLTSPVPAVPASIPPPVPTGVCIPPPVPAASSIPPSVPAASSIPPPVPAAIVLPSADAHPKPLSPPRLTKESEDTWGDWE
eukprot:GEMP01053109.1.p1 GENE.GEMP01053109.1~~GEMP01053109.1.p1  ORF type:complete len:351 (+),score=112.77 GEMP01053109.1:114-1166(+)